ncbi:hypothetical protein BGZ95_006140 [Linnemannia exigua]|uniref:Uncharacterized protein n=1 Tax=Linnemannia exigua TaxID=604196 RepID=A0AAD4D3A1_9FUNG|nr:hypothetical protein BGZ95_006140 [Linnemannia exigua]
MKVNFLLAALAAAAVSALPTSNTTLRSNTDIALMKRAPCRRTTFTWIIARFRGEINTNFLYFQIDYQNGQTYYGQMSHNGEPYDARDRYCHKDGVWCVEFAGWAKEGGEQVKVGYANQDFWHNGPDKRKPKDRGEYPRDTFEYYDCVPW